MLGDISVGELMMHHREQNRAQIDMQQRRAILHLAIPTLISAESSSLHNGFRQGREVTISDGLVIDIHSSLPALEAELVPGLSVLVIHVLPAGGVAVYDHEGGIIGLTVHGAGRMANPGSLASLVCGLAQFRVDRGTTAVVGSDARSEKVFGSSQDVRQGDLGEEHGRGCNMAKG